LFSALIFFAAMGCFFLFRASNGSVPEMELPFVANQLLSQTSVYLDKSDPEYLDLLGNSIGVSQGKIKDVQHYVLSKRSMNRFESGLLAALDKSSLEAARLKGEKKKNYFAVNVLAPYLTMLLQKKQLPENLGRRIAEDFAENFGMIRGENPLVALSSCIDSYNRGDACNVDSLHLMNESLETQGFVLQLSLDDANANLLQIRDTVADVRWDDTGRVRVILARRVIPGMLPPLLGYSEIAVPRVIIIENMGDAFAGSRKDAFEKGDFAYADKRFEDYWRAMGLNLTLERANEIHRILLERDFKGKSGRRIARSLMMETALHEAKHKTDNYDAPWLTLNLDAEFSAHVTAAIFCDAPFASLASAIDRLQNFYVNLGDAVMGRATAALWRVAENAVSRNYTSGQLRGELVQVYSDYRTERELLPLPPLDAYKDRIVPAVYSYFR
jgi:hypothetical protein